MGQLDSGAFPEQHSYLRERSPDVFNVMKSGQGQASNMRRDAPERFRNVSAIQRGTHEFKRWTIPISPQRARQP